MLEMSQCCLEPDVKHWNKGGLEGYAVVFPAGSWCVVSALDAGEVKCDEACYGCAMRTRLLSLRRAPRFWFLLHRSCFCHNRSPICRIDQVWHSRSKQQATATIWPHICQNVRWVWFSALHLPDAFLWRASLSVCTCQVAAYKMCVCVFSAWVCFFSEWHIPASSYRAALTFTVISLGS